MQLSHEWPRMSAAMRERAENGLAQHAQPYRKECEGATATITKRLISGNVNVHVQCNNCGRTVAILARKEVYNWQDLKEWDATAADAHDEARRASVKPYDLIIAERKAGETARRAEYTAWLRSAPEWHEIRKLVLKRAQGVCEACLTAPAAHVHHRTYDYGILPPAWHLKAICRDCHDRIHDRNDEWNWS